MTHAEYDRIVWAAEGPFKPQVMTLAAARTCVGRNGCRNDAHLSVGRFMADIETYYIAHDRSIRGYDGAVMLDWIPLELDPADGRLETALVGARALVHALTDGYDVDGSLIRPYYSGNRSFHVLVPTFTCGDVAPSALLPDALRRVALAIAETAKLHEIGAPPDLNLFRRCALLRAPRSWHPTGFAWKTEISIDELLHLGADEIRALATTPEPRENDYQPHDREPRDALVELYARCMTEAEDAEEERRSRPPITVTPRSEPIDIDAVVALIRPYYKPGHRDAVSLGLAGLLAKGGVPLEDAVAVFAVITKGDDDQGARSLGRLEATYQKVTDGQEVAGYKKLEDELGGDDLARLAALVGRPVAEEDAAPVWITLRDALDRPELLRAPEPLVPRLAWRGRAVLFAGPDKSGKSTIAAHAATALTRGGLWLDGRCVAGRVVWCGLEEALADAVRRFKALGADPDRVQLLAVPPAKLYEALVTLLESFPADLIVIDSLLEYARVTGGGSPPEEGDNPGWAAVIRPLVALTRSHDLALLLIHHVRRSDGQYRGAGDIAAAADVLLELTVAREGEDATLRRVRGRGRWAVEPFAVRLVGDVLELAGGEPSMDVRVMMEVERHPGSSRRQVRDRIGGRGTVIDAAVNRLVNAGAVEDRQDGRGSRLYPASGQYDFEAA